MASIAAWALAFCLLAGVATYACLRLWGRTIRREEQEALRAAMAREAAARRQAEAERRAAEDLSASERRHRALTEAGSIALWRAAPDGRILGMEGWTALTGQPEEEACRDGGAWLLPLHPEDRAHAGAAWARAIATGTEMELELRVRTPGGQMRWCRARGVPIRAEAPGPAGTPILEWVGVVEDIDDRRRSEEHRALLSREVNHRAKNLLSVVQTVVRMTRASTPHSFASSVSGRISALARAHDLLAAREWRDTELRSVLETELAAFHPSSDAGARLRIAGEPVLLAAIAVQPLCMTLHELATNAMKYGALSAEGGQVAVSWRAEAGILRLAWEESGGPPVAGPPLDGGFGTRMVDATVQGQLGGTVTRHWRPEGLACELALPLERILPRPQNQAA
jgi:PAS domain S-box-containing protein